MSVGSLRRYYLLKWRLALACDDPNAPNWRDKHERTPGTALPESFPGLAVLMDAGYTTREDIDGADVAELVALGLRRQTAEAALATI